MSGNQGEGSNEALKEAVKTLIPAGTQEGTDRFGMSRQAVESLVLSGDRVLLERASVTLPSGES